MEENATKFHAWLSPFSVTRDSISLATDKKFEAFSCAIKIQAASAGAEAVEWKNEKAVFSEILFSNILCRAKLFFIQ